MDGAECGMLGSPNLKGTSGPLLKRNPCQSRKNGNDVLFQMVNRSYPGPGMALRATAIGIRAAGIRKLGSFCLERLPRPTWGAGNPLDFFIEY
jgi:hypothetical protein